MSDTPAPIEESTEVWLEQPEELPRRPRRRLLSPLPLALLGVLGIACGFIGGVLVEKGETSSSSSSAGAASLASRLAAGRGRGSGAGAGAGAAARGSGLGEAARSGGGRATAGQVAYISGAALYVTNLEGNTVKVTTSAGTSVTKTVKASVKGIHPGEAVTVTGETAPNGTVNAESISVGALGGGGLAALAGGAGSSGSGARPTGTAAGGSGAASGGPTLFGPG